MSRYLSNIPWWNFEELVFPFGMFIFVRMQSAFAIISRKGKLNFFFFWYIGAIYFKIYVICQMWTHYQTHFYVNFTKPFNAVRALTKEREHTAITCTILGSQPIQVGSSDCQSLSLHLVRKEQTKGGIIAIIPVKIVFLNLESRPWKRYQKQSSTAICYLSCKEEQQKCCQSPV